MTSRQMSIPFTTVYFVKGVQKTVSHVFVNVFMLIKLQYTTAGKPVLQ